MLYRDASLGLRERIGEMLGLVRGLEARFTPAFFRFLESAEAALDLSDVGLPAETALRVLGMRKTIDRVHTEDEPEELLRFEPYLVAYKGDLERLLEAARRLESRFETAAREPPWPTTMRVYSELEHASPQARAIENILDGLWDETTFSLERRALHARGRVGGKPIRALFMVIPRSYEFSCFFSCATPRALPPFHFHPETTADRVRRLFGSHESPIGDDDLDASLFFGGHPFVLRRFLTPEVKNALRTLCHHDIPTFEAKDGGAFLSFSYEPSRTLVLAAQRVVLAAQDLPCEATFLVP